MVVSPVGPGLQLAQEAMGLCSPNRLASPRWQSGLGRALGRAHLQTVLLQRSGRWLLPDHSHQQACKGEEEAIKHHSSADI